ncbi:MAG: hypothetical protein ABR593_06685 [Candidatus Limnocylindria bacterium]
MSQSELPEHVARNRAYWDEVNAPLWPGESGVEFYLGYEDWIRLLRANGFEVVDLIEIKAPEGAEREQLVDPEWARRYPADQIWKVRKAERAG